MKQNLFYLAVFFVSLWVGKSLLSANSAITIPSTTKSDITGFSLGPTLSISKSSAYQIYIDQKAEKYIIKDGDRTVWEGHVNDHSQIDSLILSDNL